MLWSWGEAQFINMDISKQGMKNGSKAPFISIINLNQQTFSGKLLTMEMREKEEVKKETTKH